MCLSPCVNFCNNYFTERRNHLLSMELRLCSESMSFSHAGLHSTRGEMFFTIFKDAALPCTSGSLGKLNLHEHCSNVTKGNEVKDRKNNEIH